MGGRSSLFAECVLRVVVPNFAPSMYNMGICGFAPSCDLFGMSYYELTVRSVFNNRVRAFAASLWQTSKTRAEYRRMIALV